MTRRMIQCFALAMLCFAAFATESFGSITFRIEDVVLNQGDTGGSFFIYMDVDNVGTPDAGIGVTSVNITAGLGSGDLAGGPAFVMLGAPVAPASNALIPGVGPTINMSTASAFNASVIEPTGTIYFPAAATGMGARRMISVPFTLSNGAVSGQTMSLVFTNLTLPFNTATIDTPTPPILRTNLTAPLGAIVLQNGSITVAAVPEPGSMLAIGGALCVAGGVRHHRKKRQKKA